MGKAHKTSVRAVLDRIDADAASIARRMALAARAEVDEYGAVPDPAFADEVLAHALEHVRAFVRAGRSGRAPEDDELAFVRERGARRARELMPLDALLETYLIGQRTVWRAIVEAAGSSPAGMRTAQELTELTFRYTHAINIAVAAAYLGETRAQDSEADRRRRDLLERLLVGTAPRPDEERRADALGLRPHGDHAIVVADSARAGGPDGERLIVRALAAQAPGAPFVVARHGEVVAIVPVYVRRGPRELRAALERSAELLLRTHAVQLRAGVSARCSGLAEIAHGYGEAVAALRHAGDAATVVALEEIGLFDYLAAAADETARKLVPRSVRSLLAADSRGALSSTLRAYADSGMNVARAADHLAVHPNTVHYRLRRVQETSGRDPRRFEELVELLAAMRLGAG